MNPVETTRDGVRIRLHVQPRAARTELAGRFGDAIKVRLSSPPVDGAANEALVGFLADRLGVPRGNVELVAGHASRRKTVRVRGMSAADVGKRLGLAVD